MVVNTGEVDGNKPSPLFQKDELDKWKQVTTQDSTLWQCEQI